MIATGILLVYFGFVTRITALQTVGICVFISGGILMLFGAGSHTLFGRRHFW